MLLSPTNGVGGTIGMGCRLSVCLSICHTFWFPLISGQTVQGIDIKLVGYVLYVICVFRSPLYFVWSCSQWLQHSGGKQQKDTNQGEVHWVSGSLQTNCFMMTSSNGNIFRVTGHLCGEFTGPRWIPHTKASHAELWCFLWSASE